MPDFLIMDESLLGVAEVKINFSGVLGLEKSVKAQKGLAEGLVLRQVSEGARLVQAIYTGDPEDPSSLSLRDCDFTDDEDVVQDFLASFSSEMEEARRFLAGVHSTPYRDVTYQALSRRTDIPGRAGALLRFKQLKNECKKFHKLMRTSAELQKRSQQARFSRHIKVLPNVACPRGELCDEVLLRPRRSLNLKQLFIMPGTKWCGNKNIAENYLDLDGFVGADKCCRAHDNCPINIHGLKTEYGLYNPRLTTISHCSCDARFRSCLRSARSAPANLVGRVFFDVVKSQCFVLRKQEVCKKRKWWSSTCEHKKTELRAVLRNPKPWNRGARKRR